MLKEETGLMIQSKTSAVKTLRTLASAIESGDISNYNISQSGDGSITVKADSSDGSQRMIQTRTDMNGYSKLSTEHIQKQTPKARRKTVLQMVEAGLSQTDIAEKTMVSQKTISNDIAKLREKGKL
ncbi:MAG: HTH domain-containing protein [Oceanospirillaceae bacterium]|nr:HTH domain-containing protein [Oceanospirillaceae bacterium]